jgi:hypothetical protein
MIEIRFNNIVTITLCGLLGYALLIGLTKAWSNFKGGPVSPANA